MLLQTNGELGIVAVSSKALSAPEGGEPARVPAFGGDRCPSSCCLLRLVPSARTRPECTVAVAGASIWATFATNCGFDDAP
jgi:hypothetical protein